MEGARYLEDGRLTIFKRSGVFYARIRLSASGKYIWRSLKTTDEQTAIRGGRRLLFQMEQRADQGLPPKSKLFSAVIDDYVRFRERDHQHGKTSDGMLRQIIRVSKFWREKEISYSMRLTSGIREQASFKSLVSSFATIIPLAGFDTPKRWRNCWLHMVLARQTDIRIRSIR
jgi:hypothetical protein